MALCDKYRKENWEKTAISAFRFLPRRSQFTNRSQPLLKRGFEIPQIKTMDHHLCHAASAYVSHNDFSSDILCLTNDGGGDGQVLQLSGQAKFRYASCSPRMLSSWITWKERSWDVRQIHLLHESYYNRNGEAFLFPLKYNRRRLLDRGIALRFYPRIVPSLIDCDVLCHSLKGPLTTFSEGS